MYPGNVYFGTFSERLVASLVEADCVSDGNVDGDGDFYMREPDDAAPEYPATTKDHDSADQTIPTQQAVPEQSAADMLSFEERVKRELRHLGIIGEEEALGM